jgi:hypothetical protein
LDFHSRWALMDSNLADLIAHSSDPKTATIIIASFFTLSFSRRDIDGIRLHDDGRALNVLNLNSVKRDL